jgi:hypothetical protein
VHFLCGVGQAARVDIDANAAAGTLHVFTGLQSPNALFKVVTAARALKFDRVGIDVCHQSFFFRRPIFRWLAATGQCRSFSDALMINVGSSYATASLVKPRVEQANQRD